MNEQVNVYIEKYPDAISCMFGSLRELVYDASSNDVLETMWAGMPSYYVGNAFVRLIPFKDHINIEAKAIMNHMEELTEYKITPKGMLQIYANQTVPTVVLSRIFGETLSIDEA